MGSPGPIAKLLNKKLKEMRSWTGLLVLTENTVKMDRFRETHPNETKLYESLSEHVTEFTRPGACV